MAAGTLTEPLVIPYLLGLMAIATVPQPELPPLEQLVLFNLLLNLILLVPAAGLGLLMARRIGLCAPYLESWLDGAPRPVFEACDRIANALLAGNLQQVRKIVGAHIADLEELELPAGM